MVFVFSGEVAVEKICLKNVKYILNENKILYKIPYTCKTVSVIVHC